MAHVLVLEPDAEIRRLFGHMLTRLGHEPMLPPADGPQPVAEPDVVLLEPGWSEGVERARALLLERPGVALVAASIFPVSVRTANLQFTRHLVKPFTLRQLGEAIAEAATAASSRPVPR